MRGSVLPQWRSAPHSAGTSVRVGVVLATARSRWLSLGATEREVDRCSQPFSQPSSQPKSAKLAAERVVAGGRAWTSADSKLILDLSIIPS